jgi:NhaP-type Na+/H+ or K+/H+ antiporter
MVALHLIGSAGMGLAWGWLLGLLHARAEKPVRDALLLLGATALAAVEVFLFVDWVAAVVFVGAAALAWLLHKLWLDTLREKRAKGA